MLEDNAQEILSSSSELLLQLFTTTDSQNLWKMREVSRQFWCLSIQVLLPRVDEPSSVYQKKVLLSLADDDSLYKNLNDEDRYQLTKAVFKAIFSEYLPLTNKFHGLIAIQKINNTPSKQIEQFLIVYGDTRYFKSEINRYVLKLTSLSSDIRYDAIEYLREHVTRLNLEQIKQVHQKMIPLLEDTDLEVRTAASSCFSKLSLQLSTKEIKRFLPNFFNKLNDRLLIETTFNCLASLSSKLDKESIESFLSVIIKELNSEERNTAAVRSLTQLVPYLDPEQMNAALSCIRQTLEVSIGECEQRNAAHHCLHVLALKSAREQNDEVLSGIIKILRHETPRKMSALLQSLPVPAPQLTKEQIDCFLQEEFFDKNLEDFWELEEMFSCILKLGSHLSSEQAQKILSVIIHQFDDNKKVLVASSYLSELIPRLNSEGTKSLPLYIEKILTTFGEDWNKMSFSCLLALLPHLSTAQIQKILSFIINQLDKNNDVVNYTAFTQLSKLIPQLYREETKSLSPYIEKIHKKILNEFCTQNLEWCDQSFSCLLALVPHLSSEQTQESLSVIIKQIGKVIPNEPKNKNDAHAFDYLSKLIPQLSSEETKSLPALILAQLSVRGSTLRKLNIFRCLKALAPHLDKEQISKFFPFLVKEIKSHNYDVSIIECIISLSSQLDAAQIDEIIPSITNTLHDKSHARNSWRCLRVLVPLMNEDTRNSLLLNHADIKYSIGTIGALTTSLHSDFLNQLRIFCRGQKRDNNLEQGFYQYLAEASIILESWISPSVKVLRKKLAAYTTYLGVFEQLLPLMPKSMEVKEINNNVVLVPELSENIIICDNKALIFEYCRTLHTELEKTVGFLEAYQQKTTTWNPQKANYHYASELPYISQLAVLLVHPQASFLLQDADNNNHFEKEPKLIKHWLKQASLKLKQTDELYQKAVALCKIKATNIKATNNSELMLDFLSSVDKYLSQYADFIISYEDFSDILIQKFQNLPEDFVVEPLLNRGSWSMWGLFTAPPQKTAQETAILDLAAFLGIALTASGEPKITGILNMQAN